MVSSPTVLDLPIEEVVTRLNSCGTLVRVNFTALNPVEVLTLDFSGLSLSGAVFDEMKLDSLHFAEARLVGAQFKGASLEGAFFLNSDLRGADFSGANITYASFSGAQLEGACFANCIGIESTDLPDSVKRSARLADPGIRRFILIRHGINAVIVAIVSGSVLMGIASHSPLGHAHRDLEETRANVAKVGQQLKELTGRRDTLNSELSMLESEVSQQRRILENIRSSSRKSRMRKSQGVTQLSRADTQDLARSLNQLMSENPSSVQKYVVYFSSLVDVEQKYGSAGRLGVVDALIELNPENPGFAEFLRTSGLVSTEVSQEQIEQVFKERYDHIERGHEASRSFWDTDKSNWSQYWSQRFRDAGML